MAPGAGPQVKFQSEYVLNLWDTWEKIDIRPKSCIYEVTSQLADDSSCTLEAECVVAIPAHEDSVLRAAPLSEWSERLPRMQLGKPFTTRLSNLSRPR